MVRISSHDDTFLRIFELEASPVIGLQLQLQDKKKKKNEFKKKKKNEKPEDVGNFFVQTLKIYVIC